MTPLGHHPNLPPQPVALFTGTHGHRLPQGEGWGDGSGIEPAALPCCSVPPSTHVKAILQSNPGRQAGSVPWWPASWVSGWAPGSLRDLPHKMRWSVCTHTHKVRKKGFIPSPFCFVLCCFGIYLVWDYCSDFQINQWLIRYKKASFCISSFIRRVKKLV